MFKKLLHKIIGDPNRKIIEGLQPIVGEVAELEAELETLSDEALREKTADLRQHIFDSVAAAGFDMNEDSEDAFNAREDALEEILPEAYALVREASRRTTSLRHYDVQIMGGVLLNRGEIVEMRTGEGKTLVATLPLYLNALTGRGVHLVTVNEYLARRDGGWMGKIFHFLGLTVGCIGPQQFSALYDPEYVNPGAELEDERLVHWRPCTRREAYMADITYGISSEFGFDYLRDNMVQDARQLVQRTFNFAIIDEVDNVLIDEARTPLIISGPASTASEEYKRFSQYVRRLKRNTADEEEEPNGHYDLDEKSRSITLTDLGVEEIERRVEEIDVEAGDSLYDPRYYELTYYLENALKAEYLFHRDKDYAVVDDEVIIIDDFTGRLMPGRRYSDGLHEAIEAKEGVQVKRESVTVATITIQNYFRLYDKLAGMTGTAMTDAEEFQEIYEVEVTPLPTNVEYIADYTDPGMDTRKEKFEDGERVAYYKPGDSKPSFFKRTDFPDQVYANEDVKDHAIVDEIKRVRDMERPVLVGTTSVEHSEKIHRMLRREGIRHNVLNAKMHQSEALVVAQAGQPGAVTISTNMAGRGTDILLGGNPEGLAAEMVEKELFTREQLAELATTLVTGGEDKARAFAQKSNKLSPDLVPKLTAAQEEFEELARQIERKDYLIRSLGEDHDIPRLEAQNIARLIEAGRSNAAREYVKRLNKDTIIVDELVRLVTLNQEFQTAQKNEHQLAHFLAEQAFEAHYNARAALTRAVLAGHVEEARQVAAKTAALPAELIDKIQAIIRKTEEEGREVRRMGGLHVVGSERHESRRIDNQLRGRAARQGDPGSSRFFLSLEDELMRRFGGERLRSFMNNNIPDDMPIENRVLDRIIASSQERIEGYNFDIRKNVLEYDDVMAKQREATYQERRKILLDKLDVEEKIADAFALVIDELVDNYLENYIGFIQGEVNRAIMNFSTDATDFINVRGVLARMRTLLPVRQLDQEVLEGMSADGLTAELMELAYQNEAEGRNIYQLLQAMRRFIPILPAVPNLAAVLNSRRSGHIVVRNQLHEAFVGQVRQIFDNFLASYIEPEDRDEIWDKAEKRIDEAFAPFTSVERRSKEMLSGMQVQFNQHVRAALQDLLMDSLSALDSDQLVEALNQYVRQERGRWRERIGEEEYRRYQKLLLLSAIDREWRDYLTAADDLRREIGLESAGRQRDPKVEYKKRSYEMFADMRNNIKKDIANRFFREISQHEAFIREQQARVAYREQRRGAGGQTATSQTGSRSSRRATRRRTSRTNGQSSGASRRKKRKKSRRRRR